MTRIAFPVMGVKPTVNLFRSCRHEAPANENARLLIRYSAIVEALEVVRKRAHKLVRRGLRLVRP